MRVLQYYLSGWHIKPKGVKKPYVPLLKTRHNILTRCTATTLFLANSSGVGMIIPTALKAFTSLSRVCSCRSVCFRDQLLMTSCFPVSHHPPISAFYYISPANNIAIVGELRPKSKFLGNSVSTTMEGENRIMLLGRLDDGGPCAALPTRWHCR